MTRLKHTKKDGTIEYIEDKAVIEKTAMEICNTSMAFEFFAVGLPIDTPSGEYKLEHDHARN